MFSRKNNEPIACVLLWIILSGRWDDWPQQKTIHAKQADPVNNITFHIAETEAEREQIYRLRYEIYVEEMHIFGSVADHERRMLFGHNDEQSRLLYAKCGDELIGSLRLNLGKDAAFSEELETTYNLCRFRPTVKDEQLLVLTRFMVKKEFRGGPVAYRMIEEVAKICVTEQIEMAVCDCQPHLIRYYQRMGFRSYDCNIYNDGEFGIMIPLAFAIRDLAYLSAIRSPLRKPLDQPVDDLEEVHRITALLGTPAVRGVAEMDASETSWIVDQLTCDKASDLNCAKLFNGMSPSEIMPIISKGYLLSLGKEDLMIRRGQQTATVFMVLSGELDVYKNGKRIHRTRAGEVIGELGVILNARRSADVYVASEKAVVLSMDESKLNKRLNARTPSAAQMLHNLCQILAHKVANRLEESPKTMMIAA
ncbi:MAG: GNAT family N-acetyltransferase [Rhodothermales bacterium]